MSLIVDIKKKLSNFDLDIQFEADKDVFAILGASGSGKSMVLKCISGIEKPDSGYIEYNGKVFFDSKKKINIASQKRNVGFLFQNYALFPNMTVEENIKSGIRDKNKSINDIETVMRKFFIYKIRNRYPREISGGEQQRTALARIFISSPNILMLDEPLSALDYYIKWELEQFIIDKIKEFDGVSLFVSHSRDEVYRICDKIGVLNSGKFDVMDDKHNLFLSPKTHFAAILTGCKNFSKAKIISDKKIEVIDWNIILEFESSFNNNNINYIGIRAHYFFENNMQNNNVFNLECKIIKVIEDIFSYMIILKPLRAQEGVNIVWEFSKENYSENYKIGNIINLGFNKESILFLR